MLVSSVGSASNTQSIQPHQPPRPQMTEVAKLLGLSSSELSSELQAGKTLDELASKKGVSSGELIKTIEGELTAHKPEGAPTLSSSQLTEMATSIAAGTPPSPPGGAGGPSGAGGVSGTGGSTGAPQSSLSTLAESLGIEPSALLKELADGGSASSLLETSGYTGNGSATAQQSYAGVTFDEYA